MKNILVCIILLSITNFISYSQTNIRVFAPNYKGKSASLNTQEDFISYKSKRIDQKIVDSLGYVTLQLSTKEAIKTTIEIGKNSAILYIDPKTKRYNVYFPSTEINTEKITGQTVELLYDSLPKDDLNGLILELNYRIDDFLFGDSLRMQRLVMQDDSYKDSINAFKKILIKDYRPIKNKYFHEYIKYSVASMEQLYLARGMMMNKIYFCLLYTSPSPRDA